MYTSVNGIIYLVIFLNLYVCLEGYLIFRALKNVLNRNFPRPSGTGKKLFFWIYWPVSIGAAFLYFYFSSWNGRNFFNLASSYWGLLVFLPFFIFADAACLLLRIIAKKRPGAGNKTATLWIRTAAIVLALGTLAWGSYSARYAKTVHYRVTTGKPLPENGLTIIMVSDTHMGALVKKKELARIVSTINSLKGDLVLFAGDILDRNMDVFISERLNEELGSIKSTFGVYAVPGNHDYFRRNLSDLREHLAAAGVILLADETVTVNSLFYLAGRHDYSVHRWGQRRKSLDELTGNLDHSRLIILMDHQPLDLFLAEEAGVDLQVSGHTHRGQIWPGSIVTKRLYENDYGLLYKGKTAIVVSCGCGVWGPPVRIGARAEVVCIHLVNP